MSKDKKKKTDQELLAEWQQGDKSSASELLERHFPALYRFFINKVHESMVSDLSQDVLRQCLESRTNFRGESSFRTFLLGIARHKLLHYYRRKKRKENRLDPLSDKASDLVEARGMSSLLAKRREQALILSALRAVPIDYQIILELFFWEDLTAKECASILDIGLGAVKGRLRRAKEAFATALSESPAPPQDKASITDAMGQWIMDIHDLIGSKSPAGARKLREWDELKTDDPEDSDKTDSNESDDPGPDESDESDDPDDPDGPDPDNPN